MRRSAAKAAGKPSGKSKWVPRGEPDADREAAEMEEKEEEVVTSPMLLQPSTGPRYTRMAMLRVFELAASSSTEAAPVEAAPPADAEVLPAPEKEPLDAEAEAEAEAVEVKLGERPPEEPEAAKVPGARRALRELKKAEKLARRSSSGLAEAEAEETPSAVVQTIELSQELQPEATLGGLPPMDAALMAYLSSMAWAAPPMPPAMYGNMVGGYTTVMLRNIPNRYTRDMLIDRLNKGYEQQYDFVYLPIDFNSKCNVGYAFINFRTPAASQRFMAEFHGAKTKHCLPGFSSAKICEVTYARVQGRDANMDNLRDEKFIEKLTERPEWQPLFFDDRGREIDFSKTLGSSGKKRGSRASAASSTGASTPSAASAPQPPLPGGYMVPTPYGPMMYPAYGPPAPVPPCTLGSVLPGATSETALMLRGVPTECTRQRVIDLLAKNYKGAYDFLFVPGDPKGEGNRGFLFVNFRNSRRAQQFHKEFHDAKVCERFPVEGAGDDRLLNVQSARLASIEKSIGRAQTAPPGKGNANGSAWLPLLFAPDGEPAIFPLLASPAGLGVAAAATPLRPVPSKAVDSRALEMKMGVEAPSPDSTTKGRQSGATPKAGASSPAANLAGGYGYYPGAYGYPNALAAAQLSQAAAVARLSAAVQQAHLSAHAAAAAHAGLLEQPAGATYHQRPDASEDKKAALRKQIEFYFSPGNLCKDRYLRSHMDTSGWTPLELIARFPRVEKFKASMAEITEALADSVILEVDSVTRNMRLKDEDERKKWAREETSQAEATVV